MRRSFDRTAVNRSVGVPPACAITVYRKSSTPHQSDCRGASEKPDSDVERREPAATGHDRVKFKVSL